MVRLAQLRSNQVPLNYGRIALTLSKEQFFWGDDQHIDVVLLETLGTATCCLSHDQNASTTENQSRETAVMRAACSCLAHKNIVRKMQNKDVDRFAAEAMGYCMQMLRSRSERCLELVHAAL